MCAGVSAERDGGRLGDVARIRRFSVTRLDLTCFVLCIDSLLNISMKQSHFVITYCFIEPIVNLIGCKS